MRILFLSQVVPYPMDAGPKVRSYHMLQYLAAAGHAVTLAAFRRATDRPEHLAHLQSLCAAVHTVPIRRSHVADIRYLLQSLVSRRPFLIARDWSAEMAALLHTLTSAGGAGGFDVVHADQLWMAPYGLLCRGQTPNRPRLVLDQHNAVFQIPRRLAQHEPNPLKRLVLQMEEQKLIPFETRICQSYDRVVWVTADDKAALQARAGQAAAGIEQRSAVIPICVDPLQTPPLARRADAQRVTFIGGLHWPPNAEGLLWLAREVWPIVQQQCPTARLTVIGKNPPAELLTPQIKEQFPGLDVTGYVDDPLPYLQETAVSVVPLHAGGGMRVKILEAWGWALPIVSTTIGAEGLAYRHEDNLLIADSAPAFAQAIIRLLAEPAVAQRLAQRGRQTVEDGYDWRKIYPAWDRIYRD